MTSSSGDSGVPLDFQISSSIEDNCKQNDPSEYCPLCLQSRRHFVCKSCVQNGDFFNSSSRLREKFSEKRMRLQALEQEKLLAEKQCKTKLDKYLKSAKLSSEITMCKDRVKVLKLLIKDKKESICKRTETSKRLIEINKEMAIKLRKYQERVGKLEKFVKSSEAELKEREHILNEAREDLKMVRRTNIRQLVDLIFPISIIKPQRSDDSETVHALAEASRTAFIRGKWIFSDTLSVRQHRIVAPTLPSSGDYSPYNDWVAANKDGVPGNSSEAVDQNPAYTISAALTYTTQLVNLIAFYLDIRLPTKLCYSEFCGNELREEKFSKRVARLNWNVLDLCLSQNVDPQLLNPYSTLQNVLYLLDPSTSDLGRVGACDVDPDASRALEDSLRRDLEVPSETEDSEDDSDHLPYEWETVANVGLPEAVPGTSTQTSSSQQQISSSSVAGGLVTSAAASFASFLRGWTTNR